ncbi:MAG TPA: hypothetical protein VFA80_16070 [Xanthobacteraceae bacterium]|nr:hypothetical protein [Xanthobacteraceae bacterium]
MAKQAASSRFADQNVIFDPDAFRAFLRKHHRDQKQAKAIADRAQAVHDAAGALHTHGFDHDLGDNDVFRMQQQAARRTLQVIAKAVPYVRLTKPRGKGKAQYVLSIPGGPGVLDITGVEFVALNASIERTNAMIADGDLAFNESDELQFRPKPRENRGSRQRGDWQFEDDDPLYLAASVDVHWWGTCLCLNESEVQTLNGLLMAGAAAGALAFLDGLVPAGIAALIIGLGWVAINAADALGGNVGVCFYWTPAFTGLIVLPR